MIRKHPPRAFRVHPADRDELRDLIGKVDTDPPTLDGSPHLYVSVHQARGTVSVAYDTATLDKWRAEDAPPEPTEEAAASQPYASADDWPDPMLWTGTAKPAEEAE